MAENFTPSGTLVLTQGISVIRSAARVFRCQKCDVIQWLSLLAWFQLLFPLEAYSPDVTAMLFPMVWRCFSSSLAMTSPAKEKRRAEHSSLLKEISWKWCHMPELEGFPWRILGVWLSPSGCLETPHFSFKRCKSCCTLRSALGVLGILGLGWLSLLQQVMLCLLCLGGLQGQVGGPAAPQEPSWHLSSHNMSLLFSLLGEYYVLHLKLIEELFQHSSMQKQRS